MKQILVATDGSKGSDRAVTFAAKMAKTYGATLSIINVMGGYGLPLPVELLRQFSDASGAWLGELLGSISADILQSARGRALERGAHNIVLESRSGDTVQAIIDFANEKDTDAIVVGKHGAGHVVDFLLGSVPQKLLTLSARVIIVVP